MKIASTNLTPQTHTNTSFHVDIATQILANETLVSELVFLVFLVLDLVH